VQARTRIARVSVTRTTSATRTASAIALGAFAVHQLRYLAGLGHGPNGSEHSYLSVVLPVLIVLAASSAVGATAAALASGRAGRRTPGWAFCSAALLVIFCAQETAEGISPFAHGGWAAVPIAILIGRLVSLLLLLFRSVERRLVAASWGVPRAPAVLGRARRSDAPLRAREPLAFGLARRPPPSVFG
jgi:hypothetical protein